MSYATSLLMAYPPPYGPSTLLSDDLVQRTSRGAYYEPSVPYMSGSRLLSDSLAYNQIGLTPTIYRPSAYSHGSSTIYRSPSITNWQRDLRPENTYFSLNNVREYSNSLGTASNTTTASSMARSINDNNINGSTNIFPDYQQSYNRLLNDVDRSPHLTTIWSPTRPKIPVNDEKPTPTHRSLPVSSATDSQKKSPIEELKEDATPTPSSPPPLPPILTKEDSNLPINPTLVETKKRRPSVDIQAWLTESKNETPNDEKAAEQAWTIKIDQLHTVQAQREKEKAKSSRALPILTKRIDNKSTANDNKARITSFQPRTDSYFDSLFDGNFFRKTSTNQHNFNSPYHRTISTRNKSTTNSFNQPKTTTFAKYVPPRKFSQYEPPSANRIPPNNTSGKKQNQHDSVTPRENIHKDSDERFREALQKFRTDRAEQQQKESMESTAKRLHYGDYVRRSTKDGLLHNTIRPLPWSDFMDTKKGNLYTLKKEEKKDLYNQSRSYGEHVRNRNITLHHGDDTTRTQYRSIPFPVPNQEPESRDETSREPVNDDDNESTSTIKTTTKTYIKPTENNDMIPSRSSHTAKLTDRSSSATRPSEEEEEEEENNEDVSDFESSHRQKKEVYDSSVRTTSGTEESENNETSEERSTRMKNRDTDEDDDDDDLFTVREEKTLESLEGARYKKR